MRARPVELIVRTKQAREDGRKNDRGREGRVTKVEWMGRLIGVDEE